MFGFGGLVGATFGYLRGKHNMGGDNANGLFGGYGGFGNQQVFGRMTGMQAGNPFAGGYNPYIGASTPYIGTSTPYNTGAAAGMATGGGEQLGDEDKVAILAAASEIVAEEPQIAELASVQGKAQIANKNIATGGTRKALAGLLGGKSKRGLLGGKRGLIGGKRGLIGAAGKLGSLIGGAAKPAFRPGSGVNPTGIGTGEAISGSMSGEEQLY